MNYEHRIVCFLDILGFKELVNATVNKDYDDNEKEIDNLNIILSLVKKILDHDNPSEFSKSKRVTHFSDSIVVSFLITERSEVFYTLLDIQHLIMNLIYKDVLIRGAISYGKLIHTDTEIFGPGLVIAYETESKAALYPRVILDQTVIDLAKHFHMELGTPEHEEESLMNVVTRDTDDFYYIDFFDKAQSELDDPEYEMPSYIQELQKVIEKRKKIENPGVKVKVGWLINKFNKLVTFCKNPDFIERLRKTGELEIADFYTDLKPINSEI